MDVWDFRRLDFPIGWTSRLWTQPIGLFCVIAISSCLVIRIQIMMCPFTTVTLPYATLPCVFLCFQKLHDHISHLFIFWQLTSDEFRLANFHDIRMFHPFCNVLKKCMIYENNCIICAVTTTLSGFLSAQTFVHRSIHSWKDRFCGAVLGDFGSGFGLNCILDVS